MTATADLKKAMDLLDRARSVSCPERGDLADRARTHAYLASHRFAAAGDAREARAAEALAHRAMPLIVACSRLRGAGRRRRRRSRRRA